MESAELAARVIERVPLPAQAASGNDIREFCRRLREQQAVSGHVIVARISQSGLGPDRAESSSTPARQTA